MSVWQLYWVMKLDSIRMFLDGLATGAMVIGVMGSIICIVAFILSAVYRADDCDNVADAATLFSKRLRPFPFAVLPFAIVLFLAHALIPSTKQMAALIVVPRVISAVSENEAIQKLPGKILNLADEWVNELSPQKSDEAKESN